MKKGFGILEVLVAALVLGFMVIGLTQLQLGNREAVLRIRARDAAQIVAQQFIDSLSKVGINSIISDKDGNLLDKDGNLQESTKDYEWQGNAKNGVSSINSIITYTINAKVDDQKTMEVTERSNLTEAMKTDTTHTRAKKVDLTVSWQFKGNSTQSINVSRIIK